MTFSEIVKTVELIDKQEHYAYVGIGCERFIVNDRGIISRVSSTGDIEKVKPFKHMGKNTPEHKQRYAINVTVGYHIGEELTKIKHTKNGYVVSKKCAHTKVCEKVLVYQLVACIFKGWDGASGYVVNHLDSNPKHNVADNLEIISHTDNINHEKVRKLLVEARILAPTAKLSGNGITDIYNSCENKNNPQEVYKALSLAGLL